MMYSKGDCITMFVVSGVSLLDGRASQECEAMFETAAAEHSDDHDAFMALR